MSRVLALLVSLLLAACQTSSDVGQVETDLASATYAGIYDQPVTLDQGVYKGKPFVTGGASRPVVTLLAQPRWRVDVDSDGAEETLVLLSESSGGSGTFVYLALMSPTSSGYRNLATVLLGDRVRVGELNVLGGLFTVQIIARSTIDPASPEIAEHTVRWWQYVDGDLVELIEIAGRLTLGHEVREFAPCDEARAPLWVSDATGGVLTETVADLGMTSFAPLRAPNSLKAPNDPLRAPDPLKAPYQPLFVTLLGQLGDAPDAGFAETFDEQITVVELLRAEREGPGCGLDLAGASYRALGVEPFWALDVFADRLVLRTPSVAAKTFMVDGHSGRANLEGMDIAAVDTTGAEVRLQLRRQPCRDSMAGSRYVWQAELTLADRQLSGCALTPLPDQ